MRAWLAVLLLVGVATASAFRFWRRGDAESPVELAEVVAQSEAGGGEEPAPTDPDAAAALVVQVVDEGDDGDSGEPQPAALPATGTVAVDVAPPPGEDDRPGGAAVESDRAAREKALALVEQASRSDDPIEQARLLTSALMTDALDARAEAAAYSALQEAIARGILNPRLDAYCHRVTVEPGDSLWRICRDAAKDGRGGVTPGLVRALNGLRSDNIQPGMRLKLPSHAVSIVVTKSKFRLDLFLGDLLVRRYSVGLGKDNKTPEGGFTIKTRLVDPPWFKPGVGEVPAGHADNILGTRWLGFASKPEFPEAATFGIHGTREEDSIGTESSNGCVRMRNADVEDLFEWVGESVQVTIRA